MKDGSENEEYEEVERDDFGPFTREEIEAAESLSGDAGNKPDDDFHPVTHDECIYRAGVYFLEMDAASLRTLWKLFKDDKKLTREDRDYLESLERAIAPHLPVLAELSREALPIARDLEEEHLARIERVSKRYTEEELAMAELCYPLDLWNFEKYLCRLMFHMGIEKMARLAQAVSRLPAEFNGIAHIVRDACIPATMMWGVNRNDAWDITLSNLLKVPLPQSDEERIRLKRQFQRLKTSLAGSQAEVYFGRHGDYPSFKRPMVVGIAEEMEEAGHEATLDEVDLYTEKLTKVPLCDIVPVKVPGLIKGLFEKCNRLVRGSYLYRWSGIKPRRGVIREIGFDPYQARLADIIDEVEKSKGTKNPLTLSKAAARENIPVEDLYNFQRRRKYRKKYNKRKKQG